MTYSEIYPSKPEFTAPCIECKARKKSGDLLANLDGAPFTYTCRACEKTLQS